MSQKTSTGFDVVGQIQASGHVLSTGFYHNDDCDTQPVKCALASLSNNLVECYTIPTKAGENRLEPISKEKLNQFIRKVDVGTDMIICAPFEKVYFTSGDDNLLKGYEHYPTDHVDRVDWKKPAVRPSIELNDSHAVACTTYAVN